MSVLLEDLKRDEGFSLTPYEDSEGLLTIGYGTLIEEISKEEAQWLLEHRLEKIVAELVAAVPFVVDLPASVQRGLHNMAYNLGVPRLLGFKNMWAALEAGDYARVATEALDSKWAGQVGPRSERIAALFRSAQDG